MIFLQLSQQLHSLNACLANVTNEQYSYRVQHLGNASIGAHTRHIIELLQCLVSGYSSGTVDYVNRTRNLLLETDKELAFEAINNLSALNELADKQLGLAVEQWEGALQATPIFTTYFREVIYNTEHTIHHLALIKVAFIEMGITISDDNFGMAYSTIKYKAEQISQA